MNKFLSPTFLNWGHHTKRVIRARFRITLGHDHMDTSFAILLEACGELHIQTLRRVDFSKSQILFHLLEAPVGADRFCVETPIPAGPALVQQLEAINKAIIIKTSAETMESFYPSILLNQLGELLNEPQIKKTFDHPDETRPIKKGKVEILNMAPAMLFGAK